MRREIGPWRALANAGFVLGVLALAGFGMIQVSKRRWNWQETFHARVDFPTIAGIEPGGAVRIQGMNAGVVEAIVPPAAPGRPVTLVLRIDSRLKPLVRADASARIAMQGVVGAKVLEILPGRPDAAPLADGGRIRSEAPLEMADLLRDTEASLRRLDAVAVEAHRGLGEIGAIAAGIRRGEGSLGRLVRDDDAYNRMVALSKRGEKTLTDLEENLSAVKRIWPISGYFKDRAFFDRDLVLFQPGSTRESRTLADSDLFEPGRAVLTPAGRTQLDAIAAWFKSARRPKATEVVIAAFTDDTSRGEELALALTQKQAEAVRKYLLDQHSLDWNGLLSSRRKVAAVGFGTRVPAGIDGQAVAGQMRRVEIILFTPQA